MPDTDPTAAISDPAQPSEQLALEAALGGLLEQVARLAVARGLPVAPVEALLRGAFVRAAAAAHPGVPEHRKVSRIATTTGLNRREVTRLVQQQAEAAPPRPHTSAAGQLFRRWHDAPDWRDEGGRPRVLPRLGASPSFEALAQQVTRDVHPRSLLDELVRLGLVHWDPSADTVALAGERFVARGDAVRQLAFLGDNVGDHLRAAVDNVLDGAAGAVPRHVEQAVFAWGLSAESLAMLEPAIRAQWRTLVQALAPALRERVEADAATAPRPGGRIRIGLYSYHEGAVAPPVGPGTVRRRAVRPAPRKHREPPHE
jgi:hypothetical protein